MFLTRTLCLCLCSQVLAGITLTWLICNKLLVFPLLKGRRRRHAVVKTDVLLHTLPRPASLSVSQQHTHPSELILLHSRIRFKCCQCRRPSSWSGAVVVSGKEAPKDAAIRGVTPQIAPLTSNVSLITKRT